MHGFFSALSFSTGLYFCFVPAPYCLDFSFIVLSEIRKVDSASFTFLSQDCSVYSESLCFHTHCGFSCSSSEKNVIGSLIGIALNL